MNLVAVPSSSTTAAGHSPGEDRWGERVQHLWALDPGLRFLNHGGFGATPVRLSSQQAEWRARIERNPPRFFMKELPGQLRATAVPLAAFAGTAPERLGFVINATAGMNAVLRSLDFAPGDEILLTDHAYNAARNAVRYVADRMGAHLVEVTVGPTVQHSGRIIEAVAACVTARTRLVVVDHIASASAIEFPVAEIVALCRSRGIRVLVDGAHAPGMLDLEIDALGADYYVGNCHKWLCAPKGAAFLAVAEHAAQTVHPLAISHAYGQGFAAEFDKIGTHDPSAVLTIPTALAFHVELGGAELRVRNRALALRHATTVAHELGTELGASPDLFHAMATVRLPGDLPATRETMGALNDWLWRQHRIEAAFTAVTGTVFLRISAQAYNRDADYADLAPILRAAIDAVRPGAPA